MSGDPKATISWRHETEIAIAAVVAALAQARSGHGAGELTMKGARDIVTATDVAIEDAVRAGLVDALDAPVIGEERGGDATAASYWIVDPICGTRNFASGIPLYCVNLALIEDERVTVAVIGDPSTGDLLVSEADRGAWALNDGVMRSVSTSAESQMLVIEDSHAQGARRRQAASFAADAILADQWDLRSFSTTLSLAYVATGRVAGYVLFWTSAIHAAAGSLLAAEAGALVSDPDGRPWTLSSDSLVASASPELHLELVARAREASPLV
jgi:myo-inositol-1(or 4)-monophosphatase